VEALHGSNSCKFDRINFWSLFYVNRIPDFFSFSVFLFIPFIISMIIGIKLLLTLEVYIFSP